MLRLKTTSNTAFAQYVAQYKILFGFGRAKNNFNNLVNHRLRMEKILFGTRRAINNRQGCSSRSDLV